MHTLFKHVHIALLAVGCLLSLSSNAWAQSWEIGSGIHDITGPAAEAVMVGYGDSDQVNRGIHMRLWSRAYVMGDPLTEEQVVFVSADLSHIPQGVKQGVIRRLQAVYGERYNDANVMLTATHTHVGPGNYNHHIVLNSPTSFFSAGFDPQHYDTIVEGIFRSIERAVENVEPGDILLTQSRVNDVSVNRNPDPYSSNPDAWQFNTNVNDRMTQLRLVTARGDDIGVINWFALHNVSYSADKKTISGDNKGIASYLFEERMGADPALERTFVAAFANSNLGDVSPNVCGPQDGCTLDETDAALLSGTKQFNEAVALFQSGGTPLRGELVSAHTYEMMPDFLVGGQFTRSGQAEAVCDYLLGEAFKAGSLWDGPSGLSGSGWQSNTVPCHAPKHPMYGISFMSELENLYPRTLPFQIFVLGQFALVSAPGEMTTMAGRRLERAVLEQLRPMGVEQVVIAGLANAYSGYVTTPEEYDWQRYEGGHTIFGPNTLPAYLDIYTTMSAMIANNLPIPGGNLPPDLINSQLIQPISVITDALPPGQRFGDVLQQPGAHHIVGQGHVEATFRSGHPKNNYLIQDSFFNVERRVGGRWETYLTDRDLSTEFKWYADRDPFAGGCVACSKTVVFWTPDAQTPSGTYRLVHNGTSKDIFSNFTRYVGVSEPFTVANHRALISLSTAHGTFLQAVNQGGGDLRAEGHWVRSWEKFELVHIEDALPVGANADCVRDGSLVALGTSNGHYASALPDGSLLADAPHTLAWESFELQNFTDQTGCLESGDEIALRGAHGLFAVAEPTGEALADRVNVGPWERFIVMFEQEPASLTARLETSHGTRLLAEEGGGLTMTPRGDGTTPWEQLELVRLSDFVPDHLLNETRIRDGQAVALRTTSGSYAAARGDELNADGVLESEQDVIFFITLIDDRDGDGFVSMNDDVALQSSHGKFVSAQPGGGVHANRGAPLAWETFTLIP